MGSQPTWTAECTRLVGAESKWKPERWDDWECTHKSSYVCSLQAGGDEVPSCEPGTIQPQVGNPCMSQVCSTEGNWRNVDRHVQCDTDEVNGGDCLPEDFTPPGQGECCGSCSRRDDSFMTQPVIKKNFCDPI